MDLAIKVAKVYKSFLLPHEKNNSLKARIVNPFKNNASEVQHALRGINFEVKSGEFFGIVGRNGSGKSTLLKILGDIYQPTKGSVRRNGKLVPFIELGVGFNPELTGRENVYLNGALLGFSRKEIAGRYDDIVKFAELEDFMDQKLKNYSSGMQVRLAFSVATRAKADILLIDEVLAVGDADFQRKCFNYFKSLKKSNTTVIFVSHDMNAVREYCDRAIMIEDGKIVSEGKAEKVAQDYLGLFNENVIEESQVTDGDNRWGNKWAWYTSVESKINDRQLIINLELEAGRDINNVVYGFRIKNEAGEEVAGTNSSICGRHGLNLQKNKKTNLQWIMPNIFSNGAYYIEPAITLVDGVTVCDWWNEAKKFNVKKACSTSYIVTPEMQLTIGNIK